MAKILVVDDETDLEILIKQKFRKKIRSKEYEFVFAHDGQEALETLQNDQAVDMVLSDINMPKMDGLTLLGHLKEDMPLVKSVMVSAYGDMANIRTAMNRGAFDFITKPIDFNDLTITMEKTLRYVKQLKSRVQALQENNILKMYVDESVLNFMGTKDYESKLKSNESIEATVAFIDICGFTRLSEQFEANQVVNILNDYFGIMVNSILENQGYVDKFIGDAVMAVFKSENNLENAIKAAIAIRKTIDALPNREDLNSYKPAVSIGIASGEMISGNIGAANLKRLDYTVIGNTVNTASRLQDKAMANQIVIQELCYNKAKESFECEYVGEFELKNKVKEVRLYNIIG